MSRFLIDLFILWGQSYVISIIIVLNNMNCWSRVIDLVRCCPSWSITPSLGGVQKKTPSLGARANTHCWCMTPPQEVSRSDQGTVGHAHAMRGDSISMCLDYDEKVFALLAIICYSTYRFLDYTIPRHCYTYLPFPSCWLAVVGAPLELCTFCGHLHVDLLLGT